MASNKKRNVRTGRKPNRKLNRTKKFGEYDYTFLFLLFMLLAFGLVMLLSASAPSANTKIGDSYYFFIRQLSGAAAGVVIMVILSNFDYHMLKKYAFYAFWIGLTLVFLCRIPPFGVYRNGAWRWLRTPFIQLQPSEFMKPLIALYFAKLISERKYKPDTLKGMLPYAFALGLTFILMWAWQSHMSGAIVICAIGGIVLLVAGMKMKYILGVGAVAVPVIGFYIMQDPMRMGRIMSFIDPFRDTADKSYQIAQSLIAIGSGGFFGRGLGQSVQKYGFLPEPYNDFIFAIVCEELGLLGALIIIALFAMFVIRGFKIAMEAPDTFGMLSVIGIISHVAIQTVFNIAVVSSAIPVTGMSLPFFSFGGTAIMVLLAEMGIVLNVSRQSKKINKLPN